MASAGGLWLGGVWDGVPLRPQTYAYPSLNDFHSMRNLHDRCCRSLYATGISFYQVVHPGSDNWPIGNVFPPVGDRVWPAGQGGSGENQRHEFGQGLETMTAAQAARRALVCRPPPGLEGMLVNDITTMMVRNLPRRVSFQTFVDALDLSGFADAYDYVYMPPYCQQDDSRKHAFVNFRTPHAADIFKTHWHNSRRFGIESQSKVTVAAAVTQGFDDNVAKRKAAKQEAGFRGKGGYGLLILWPPSPGIAPTSSAECPTDGGERLGPSDPSLGAIGQENVAPSAPSECCVPMPLTCTAPGTCRYLA